MSTATLIKPTAGVPVAGLSIFDPIHFGINEVGRPVRLPLMYRNILIGGEPGGGKSVALNCIVGHAAVSTDVDLWLLDGKHVELGMWWPLATEFVGPNLPKAIAMLKALQADMDRRYVTLLKQRRRKITVDDIDSMKPVLFVCDELALFAATFGSKQQQEEFCILLRDIVARGRAVGIICAVATQRPSSDIIPTSLRDLFAYRLAFRCTAQGSSDVVLGHGWAASGYNAVDIAPTNRGEGFLLAEGGIPERIKTPDMSNDQHIEYLVRVGACLRGLGKQAAVQP